MKLSTIGYEGLSIDDFLALLKTAGVETVVNIRQLPLSRKRGFSKNGLRQILEDQGLRYRHIVALGCPKPIRDRYRADKDWAHYTRDFTEYLASQRPVLAELSAMAETSPCALMCFEADYRMCHRSMVADAVHRISGLQIAHLQATGAVRRQHYVYSRTRSFPLCHTADTHNAVAEVRQQVDLFRSCDSKVIFRGQ